jgi:hypothetical protein
MEAIEIFNNYLEQLYWFRAFKFILGFYLIIMAITVALILFRLVKKYSYWTTLTAGQEFKKVGRGKFQIKWEKVMKRVNSSEEDSWKVAVLEAAQMLDEVFKIVKYDGDTLGDRLENITSAQLDNLEEVKGANEVKNKIVQDEKFQITQEEAKKAVTIFGDALKFFEAII